MAEELHTILNRSDESFNPDESQKYDLTFELGEKSFGYSILDTIKNRYVAIGYFRNHLADVAAHNTLLQRPYHSVKGIIGNSRFTLIPEDLYLEEEKEKYFTFLHDHEAGDKVYSDRIEHLGVYSVYSIPGHSRREIDHFFPAVAIGHISSVLIRNLWVSVKNMTGRKIFLNLRDGQFDVLVFDGRQLIYCNAFHFMTPEDVAYYLIFVFEQLNLNPEEISLALLGSVDRYSPVYDLLFRYIRNIEFAARNDGVSYSYLFNEIPDHFYYSLLNPVV
ncbi:MAG: DUF3822 family protein [Bacteroidetes bacterium]|nr:DUF3822 family protein [Bacteroidota bacterium]